MKFIFVSLSLMLFSCFAFAQFKDFGFPTESNSIVFGEATYFIIASNVVRPNQLYRIGVSLISYPYPLSVRASLLRNGVDIGSATQEVRPGVPESLIIKVPPTSAPGSYRLRVEGNTDRTLGGTVFQNETVLEFSQRSMTIMVQTEKPVYKQSQTVRFRAIPVNTELRAFDDAVDVYMLDPKGNVVRRWLSRQSNFGSVSLEYILSNQPVYGKWTIRIIAQGQVEETHFFVEEYYQTRFEVNVTMPSFVFDTEDYITGSVMSNYTSGSPVKGNLTLQAILKPYRFPARRFPGRESTLVKNLTFVNVERGWFKQISPRNTILDYYNGYYEFNIRRTELLDMVPNLDGFELKILASVTDRLFDERVEGFAETRFYNRSSKLTVVGGSPQVFKPAMPFTFYVAISHQDGSMLSKVLTEGLEIRPVVALKTGGTRPLNPRKGKPSTDSPGVWEVTIDLRSELGRDKQAKKLVDEVAALKASIVYTDQTSLQTSTTIQLVTQFSPGDKHLKILTSTTHPTVGEFIIFHVRANYHVESFSYVILSHSTILLTGREEMTHPVTTFAVSLSAEMAPIATAVVYHVDKTGQVIADALNFPVNGFARNNFTLKLNPRKDKSGDTVEVVILGEPGSYVGLSSVDKAFYGMQAGNELSYSDVVRKMATFDKDFNGTHSFSWISREGYADDLLFFPSSTYGIDANRTFEFANLVVFTDANVVRRFETCNKTFGQGTCLSGACYPLWKRCDGAFDCQDHSDEKNCASSERTELLDFRMRRINRLLRMYENRWIWKDINIGPHGHYIFNAPIPEIPAYWVVSAFGVSPKAGFGLARTPAEYAAFKPFYMNVEMPSACRQGEQIGIRVSLFNYLTEPLEVIVVLMGSNEHKFIHVEAFGQVNSYNPRTSFGEHQHLMWIPAQGSAMVYLPIVPAKLGEITVTVEARTMVRKDRVVRKVRVEADGLPQYRHTSVVLDLSNRAWFFQYVYVNVTESPLIPYSKERYYVFGSNRATVTVVGDVVGPAFATMPMNATSLLHKPMDCGEQNMFSFGVNLYTIKYLRLVRDDRKKEIYRDYRDAFTSMNILYQKQLSYQNYDGSFSYFRSDWGTSAPSVWLTSFCAKVLTDANFNEWENYLFIDTAIMVKAVSYLVKHQTPDGAFYEPWLVADRKSTISSNWRDDSVRFRNVSLTAHVLISLVAVKDLPGELGPRIAGARSKAIMWLDRNLDLLQENGDPYEIAIVSYALLVAKATSAERAFSILVSRARKEGGYIYWGREQVPLPAFRLENQKPFLLPRLPYNYDASNIEATAYALLTYVARQEYDVEPIVKWLNTQRLTDGGWASTQDTIIALQALAEYTVRHRIREVTSLTLEVEATSNPDLHKKFHISEKNLAVPQSVEIPNAWGHVRLQARGAGYAILNLHLQYNVDQQHFVTQPPEPAFSLRTRAFTTGRNSSLVTFRTCQRWTNLKDGNMSGMAVLEVPVPTGYMIQQQTLDSYALSGQVRNLRYARYLDTKVAFYFDYLDLYDTCVNLTLERWHPVANMTRHMPFRVYDYYAPERFNETLYDALELYALDICQVCGSYQCPYCPLYSDALYPSPSISVVISTFFLLVLKCSTLF